MVAPITPEQVVAEAQSMDAANAEEAVEENNVVETAGVAPQEEAIAPTTPEQVVAEAQAMDAANTEEVQETTQEAINPEEGFAPEAVAVDNNAVETPGVAPEAVQEEVVQENAITPEEIVANAQALENANEVPTEEVSAETVAPEASVDVNVAVPPVVGEDIEVPAVETAAEEKEEVTDSQEEQTEEVQEDMPMGGLTPDEIVAQAQAMDEGESEATEEVENAQEEEVADSQEEQTEEVTNEEEVVPTVDEEIVEEENKLSPSEVMAQAAEEETKVAEVSPEEVADVTDASDEAEEENKDDVELNIDEDEDINDNINDDIEDEVVEEKEEIKKPTSLIDLVDDNDYYEPKEFKADTISLEDALNDFDNSFDDIRTPGASMIENIKAGYEKALDDNARYRNAINVVKKKYEDEHAENNRLRANHEKDLEIIAQYKDNQDILVTKYKELQAELRKTQKQLNGLYELNQLVEAHSDSYVRTGRRSTNYDLDDIISSGRGRRAA